MSSQLRAGKSVTFKCHPRAWALKQLSPGSCCHVREGGSCLVPGAAYGQARAPIPGDRAPSGWNHVSLLSLCSAVRGRQCRPAGWRGEGHVHSRIQAGSVVGIMPPCTASNQVSMAAHHRRPGTETQARGSVSAAGDDCGGWWALHKRGVSSNPKSQIYGPLCEGKLKKKSYLQLFVRPRDLQPVGWLSDSFTENLQMVCHTCASYRGRGFFSRGPSLPGQFPAIGMA